MLKIFAVALSAILLWPQAEVQAQSYPSKPIRFVIPFGAGSATDALARIAGQELEQTLGQPIIVVPKPGADGALAASDVKHAAPDGYTFMFGTNSPLAVVPNMQKNPPYNVLTDFTPVTYLGDNSFFIVVHPSVQANSIAELIAVAKASPTPLNYATGNTYAFVSMAMFAEKNGIKLEAVRYKSEPDAMTDMLSGRVQIMNGTATSVLPHVKAGRLRALSTSLPVRSPLLPEASTVAETLAGFEYLVWHGVVVPAKTPPAIINKLAQEIIRITKLPDFRERLNSQGLDVIGSTPEEFGTLIKKETGVFAKLVKQIGYVPQ